MSSGLWPAASQGLAGIPAQTPTSSPNQTTPTRSPPFDPGCFRPADTGAAGIVIDPMWEAPRTAFSLWERCWISTPDGRLEVPGKVTVSCIKSHRVDPKKAPGLNNARLTLLGWDPGEVDIVVTMWTTSHLQQYETLINSMQKKIYSALTGPIPKDPNDQRRQSAFDVDHPGLRMYRISSLVLKGFTIPKLTGTPQVYEAMLRFIEFAPLTQASAPVGIGGSSGAEPINVPSVYGQPQKPQSPDVAGGANAGASFGPGT